MRSTRFMWGAHRSVSPVTSRKLGNLWRCSWQISCEICGAQRIPNTVHESIQFVCLWVCNQGVVRRAVSPVGSPSSKPSSIKWKLTTWQLSVTAALATASRYSTCSKHSDMIACSGRCCLSSSQPDFQSKHQTKWLLWKHIRKLTVSLAQSSIVTMSTEMRVFSI